MNVYLNASSYTWNNISITFKENDKEDFQNFIKRIIIEILKENNSYDMKQIIDIYIPQNFIDEITNFEKKYNLDTYNTNEKEYMAIGKCLKYQENNTVHFALFYDITLILPFLLTPDKISEYAYNLSFIEHEIIHAIDIYKHSMLYNYYSHKDAFNDYNKFLTNKSIDYWKEYLANRAGHYHLEKNIKPDIDTLSIEISKYESEFKKIRKNYKYNADLDLVVASLNNQLDYLIKRCIYQLGAINSLNASNSIMDYFKEKIKNSLILSILDRLSFELEKIYIDFGQSKNINFTPINDIILKYWSSFGIYVKNTDQGIYFSIPYTFDLF